MKKRREDPPPAGSPAWMATFSDLMNLLLCFFVLLFSMSSVEEEKFQQVVASFQSALSILPTGGPTIGQGEMISGGVSMIEFLDYYYSDMETEDTAEEGSESAEEAYKQETLEESEQMAEAIGNALEQAGLQDTVDVNFNAEAVTLRLSGAILFRSGEAEVIKEAEPILDKVGYIIQDYKNNLIEVEGHTDNVPMVSDTYEDNDVLSMYRALNVANRLREITDIEHSHIKSSGRGEYDPVAENATAEGRARNRRVEIKIYNSYNSNLD